MRIARLCDVPQHIQALAQAHVQAFGALLPDWNVAQAAAELASHGRDAVPMTWVLLQNMANSGSSTPGLPRAPQQAERQAEQWLGSVSLLREDHPGMLQFSPWLASLYVRPHARRQGVAKALIEHCIAVACAQAVPRLYLYCTQELTGFYQKLGWWQHAQLPLGPLQVSVMAIDIGLGLHD